MHTLRNSWEGLAVRKERGAGNTYRLIWQEWAHIGAVWFWCASACFCLDYTKVRKTALCVSSYTSSLCFIYCLFNVFLAFAEQSCAQGFQSWGTVSATDRAKRIRQFIFPSLNFSCGGVIRSWTLRRFEGKNGGIGVGHKLVFQLWNQVEENGLESSYALRTEETYTASTGNAPSYTFEASPAMTVVAGDVFGFYVSTGIGLRLGVVSDAGHIMFTVQAASATEFRFTNPGSNTSPLVFIEFSKSFQLKIAC